MCLCSKTRLILIFYDLIKMLAELFAIRTSKLVQNYPMCTFKPAMLIIDSFFYSLYNC